MGNIVPLTCQLNQAFLDRVKPVILKVWNDIAADQLVREQCKIHGYTKVLKYLSKNIRLV